LPKAPISQRTYNENRPTNFYELCIDNEPAVCTDLERRLNIVRRPATVYDDVNSFYLGFDVPVQGWRSAYGSPADVPQNLPKGAGWLRTLTPRLALDLNGDGQQEVLYRTSYSLGGVTSIVINWTEWPPNDDQFDKGVELNWQPYPNPNNASLVIGPVWPDNLREYLPSTNAFRLSTNAATTDITRSMGHYYLVVAMPWATNSNRVSRVLVAAMNDAQSGRLVCLFDARYRVMPG